MFKESPLGHWRIIWPFALALTVVFASNHAVPPEVAPLMIFAHGDKIVHFFVFGLLATLIVRLRLVQRNRTAAVMIAVGLTSLFGVSDELHQAFTPGRSCDVFDWITDTSGALVAVWCYLRWTNYRKVLEWRLIRGETANVRIEMMRSAVPTLAE